jgi:hypothetical protein
MNAPRSRRVRRGGLYLMLVLMPLALLSIMSPVSAHAQAVVVTSNVRLPFTEVISNACTNETIVLNGVFHQVTQIVRNPTEDALLVVQRGSFIGSGVGLTSGTSYWFNQVINNMFTINGIQREFTTAGSSALISQASADNLIIHISTHQTINSNGEVTAEISHISLECRG